METKDSQPKLEPPVRRHALATLRHRDFRLLWFGQLVSTIGDQMQSVAIAWQIFVLTDSSLHVGLVGLSRVVPFLLLSFVGGAVADIVSRKRLILSTQSILMLSTAALVFATATGTVTPGFIYAISVISGAASAFDGPARQSILPNLVPRAELANALTLHTILRQTATIIGPGIGGVVIGLFGLAAAYAVNVVSFLAVILALVLMSVVPAPKRGTVKGWDTVLGGLRYVRREPLVLGPLLLDFVVTCLRSYRSLLPVFARDILAVGPQGLGLLHSAGSVGALAAALTMGTIGEVKHKFAVMIVAYASQGIFLIAFGLSSTFYLSLLMLAGYGIGNVASEVMRNTIVQLKTPDNLRGRVSALGSMFTSGGPQLGQVQMGAVASMIGPIGATIVGGVAVVLACAGFATLPSMRRGMREWGIEESRLEAKVAER
jgi:MFS family permease